MDNNSLPQEGNVKEYQCECGFICASKFCTNCGRPHKIQVETPPVNQTSVEKINLILPVPEETIGWTCTRCKAENQVGEKCEVCGEEIKKQVLFTCNSYMTCMPPRTEGATVYAFSDTQLICEIYRDGVVKRRFIPAEVAKDAQEIIHANGIDKWRDYENVMGGMMGGSVSVRYLEGDTLVGSSMDKMGSIVVNAFHQLMTLFSKE